MTDLFNYSSYLQQLQRSYPQLLSMQTVQLADLRAVIDELRGQPLFELKQTNAELRRLKAKFDYIWSQLRLEDINNAKQLGSFRSEFAQVTIAKALALSWAQPKHSNFLSKEWQQKVINGNAHVPGLFILGLGKLGGHDLNFSSDVDLIAFYDPKRLPVQAFHGRTDVCVRVLQLMTQTLSKVINGESVWRVDWRLRPDSSVTPIVMSTPAAVDFYYFHSLPWHRLALIKARCMAGDSKTCEDFLHDLSSFVWRQNLDYVMLDDIAQIKDKINREHPQLNTSRNISRSESEFNVKLGRGGIREIEFMVNAIQLLWGGKKVELRNTCLLEVLPQLVSETLLNSEQAQKLAKHYCFFRLLEDCVQLKENVQLHRLPSSEHNFSQLEQLVQPCIKAELLEQLMLAKKEVIELYDAFFGLLSGPEKIPQAQIPDINQQMWAEHLNEINKNQLQRWFDGFSQYAVPVRQAKFLEPLFMHIMVLLNTIASKDPDKTNIAIERLHQFFSSIPKGGQYLRLLAEHPIIFDNLALPLLHSPAMATLLQQSPHILEQYAEPQLEQTIGQFDGAFVLQSKKFEVRLARLRRHVNEQLYDHMLLLFNGKISAIELQKQLTLLAEHALQLGLDIVCDDMGLDSEPISILALGKLGMAAMAPQSDLDLIFICKEGQDIDFANRFASRFRHLMDVQTQEGRAYEMDMRLRPSGNSGPVTVTLKGFKEHHLQRAKNWEHIALVSARVVTGDKEAINAARAQVLSSPRSAQQFLLDAKKMHNRIREQRISEPDMSPTHFNVKLRVGGLFETDYYCACQCILSVLDSSSFSSGYAALLKQVFDNKEGSQKQIIDTVYFWQKLQIWGRVLGFEEGEMTVIPEHQMQFMLKDMAVESLDQLQQQAITSSGRITEALAILFEPLSKDQTEASQHWTETKIEWL